MIRFLAVITAGTLLRYWRESVVVALVGVMATGIVVGTGWYVENLPTPIQPVADEVVAGHGPIYALGEVPNE